MNKPTKADTIAALLRDPMVKSVDVDFIDNSKTEIKSRGHFDWYFNNILIGEIKSFKPNYHPAKEIGVGDWVWVENEGEGVVVELILDAGVYVDIDGKRINQSYFELSSTNITLIQKADNE